MRYLERAFSKLDFGQLKLVFEALHERRRLLANAPHLTSELPIMMPCYRWWEVPYFWGEYCGFFPLFFLLIRRGTEREKKKKVTSFPLTFFLPATHTKKNIKI